ncbi:MAG: hypothetical protein JXJ22_14630 [Bacteroidales bacterium]|nr:hypothetical protein [Bacteroidales bacterium]
MKKRVFPLVFLLLVNFILVFSGEGYKNFDVSIYCVVDEVQQMKDPAWLKSHIEYLEKYIKIEKVYLETHRADVMADKATILSAKKYFEKKGIKVAGGITLVVHPTSGRYETFCYSDEEHVKRVRDIVQFTASLFDEVILDDFYFTNCKCTKCIANKGDQSWSEFKMAQLTEMAEKNIVGAAKEVNPNAKVIIKYPNWYEHFHFLGFNLEGEPKIFDGIYTGTETRDPDHTDQHLQQYLSYSIMRYFENIAPGRNGGGWIDPFNRNNIDRYGEQISLTAFSKPKEITLFSIHAIIEEISAADGSVKLISNVAPEAGYVFEKADNIVGRLGQPLGLKCYRPYNSTGEDFLHNFIGMLGIPIEITPEFPTESKTTLLTENTAFDPQIVEKIKTQLFNGNDVIITSGLLKALQGKGIEEMADIRFTDKKALVHEFSDFRTVFTSASGILIPQIIYPTNDTWEDITAYGEANGFPILLETSYANGTLYVMTIPDNFGDLYNLPEGVITLLKKVLMQDFYVHTESRSKIALFVYDNNTFIVHSFLSEMEKVKVVVNGKFNALHEMNSGMKFTGVYNGKSTTFDVVVSPHSYLAFKVE